MTGVVTSDATSDELLAVLTSALGTYDLEVRKLDSGLTQLVVRPAPQ